MAQLYFRAKHQLAALFISSEGRVTLVLHGRDLRLFVGQRVPRRAICIKRLIPELNEETQTDSTG